MRTKSCGQHGRGMEIKHVYLVHLFYYHRASSLDTRNLMPLIRTISICIIGIGYAP